MSDRETLLFEQTYDATLEAVARARRAIRHILAGADIQDDQLQNLLLVCSEWMANLVKHADEKPTQVKLSLGSYQDDHFLMVEDNGSSFTIYDELMSEREATPFEVELGENGLGLRLIKHMFPKNSYHAADESSGNMNVFQILYPKSSSKIKRLRIAIIDDDQSMRILLEAYLSAQYEVITFENGQSALNYLQNNTVELVISDIQMPGMNGMEFRRELAARPDTDIIPFIFLTSDEGEQLQDEAADLGVDDYLGKPISKPKLLNVTKRLLKRAQHLRKNVGLQLEEKVTQTLAPTLPNKLLNFACEVRTISAETGGGDFLAHIESDENVKIFFGDVMGHGLQAKFFAHAHVGYLNGILRSLKKSSNIGTLLGKFSDAIADDELFETTTLTCVSIALHENGTVDIANAAHPKPWIITDETHDARMVGDVGALLGLIPGNKYPISTYNMMPGDRVVLYTDGFIEIGHNPKEREESEARIPDLIAQVNELPLNKFADALYEDFMRRCNSRPQDDMTLVILELIEK